MKTISITRASNIGFDELERLETFEKLLALAPRRVSRNDVQVLAERLQFFPYLVDDCFSTVDLYASRSCRDAGASPIATVTVHN